MHLIESLMRRAVVVGLAAALSPAHADDFAHAVVEYIPGSNPATGYGNPARALGAPARVTGEGFDPGAVTPFQPAWQPDELVSIGAGGSLTLAFDPPLANAADNPHGIDFLVFGNSFFADLSYPEGVVGGLIADGGLVEASPDGVTWIPFPLGAADGFLPTMGYRDVGPYAVDAGAIASDCHLPVDPSITAESVVGIDYAALRAVYAGSAGGSGFDLASVGLSSAVALRIRVPSGPHSNVEIDAVARVKAPPAVADINRDGAVDGLDLGYILATFGSADSAGDLDGSGVVDANDLTVVLAGWSV